MNKVPFTYNSSNSFPIRCFKGPLNCVVIGIPNKPSLKFVRTVPGIADLKHYKITSVTFFFNVFFQGGMKAVVWNDVFQFLIMLIGIILIITEVSILLLMFNLSQFYT